MTRRGSAGLLRTTGRGGAPSAKEWCVQIKILFFIFYNFFLRCYFFFFKKGDIDKMILVAGSLEDYFRGLFFVFGVKISKNWLFSILGVDVLLQDRFYALYGWKISSSNAKVVSMYGLGKNKA